MNIRALFYLLLIIGYSSSVESQFEFGKKKIKLAVIPKKEAPNKEFANVKPAIAKSEQIIKYQPNYFKNAEEELIKSMSTVPKIGEIQQKTYPIRKSGELYENKFKNKESQITERFKSDTFLGEFKTGSKTIRISCRDHEYPDGDLVRIWINDKIALDRILLDVNYTELFLELQEGFNKIEFEALNQGTSGPNTAQFTIVDKLGNIITNNRWNLTTGVKAKVIVFKENDELKTK